jgi:hypothetical protein
LTRSGSASSCRARLTLTCRRRKAPAQILKASDTCVNSSKWRPWPTSRRCASPTRRRSWSVDALCSRSPPRVLNYYGPSGYARAATWPSAILLSPAARTAHIRSRVLSVARSYLRKSSVENWVADILGNRRQLRDLFVFTDSSFSSRRPSAAIRVWRFSIQIQPGPLGRR